MELVLVAVLGAAIGCATAGEESGPRGLDSMAAGPTPNCQQYLAILSDERKQTENPSYGVGGSCWTGTAEQAKSCDQACKHSVHEIIRRSLHNEAASAES